MFFKQIKDDPTVSARALIFCILTATRTTESIEATWNEFDLDKKLWIIPKSRMKRSIEHRVPISTQLHSILKPIEKSTNEYLFEGQRLNKSISSMSMIGQLRKLTSQEKSVSKHWLIRSKIKLKLRISVVTTLRNELS